MLANEEYVPRAALMTPTTIIATLAITWVRVALLCVIFKKHKAGIMTATSILSRDPIRAITKPKNGRTNAMTTVDATRLVLSIIETIVSFKNPSGRNSSKLRANGFNNKANLVNGLITVVHRATFEANDSFGRFKVICDRVLSPNMR